MKAKTKANKEEIVMEMPGGIKKARAYFKLWNTCIGTGEGYVIDMKNEYEHSRQEDERAMIAIIEQYKESFIDMTIDDIIKAIKDYYRGSK